MSADLKDQPNRVKTQVRFFSAESLDYARDLLSALEDELKENAIELASADGRDTVSEDDMRNAALGLLAEPPDDLDESSEIDA